MIRFSIFVFAILAYSSIGLVAFSQLAPATLEARDTNVTVVYKTGGPSVVAGSSPELQRCVADGCVAGISI